MSLDNDAVRNTVSVNYGCDSRSSCGHTAFPTPVDGVISTQEVISLVAEALDIDEQVSCGWNEDSALYGALPELDSMSVMAVLAAIEQKYSVRIEHHDVELDAFDSVKSLKRFVASLI